MNMILRVWVRQGFEARVFHVGIGNRIYCIKKYKRTAATIWLRKNLHSAYNKKVPKSRVIAHHEKRALTLLSQLGSAPKPLGICFGALIMEYGGVSIENLDDLQNVDLESEGNRLFNALTKSGIRHNDIKASNILILNNHLLLVDFTFADIPNAIVTSYCPPLEWGRFGKDDKLRELHKFLPV